MPSPWWFRRGTERRTPVRLTAERLDDRTVPTAVNDSFTVQIGGGATVFDVIANDTGTGNTVTAVTDGAKGKVEIVGNGAKVQYNLTDSTFFGTDTFTYEVTDGAGAKSTGSVSVFVNRPPEAKADTTVVQRGSGANAINVLANDSDPDAGQTLKVSAITQGLNGAVAISSNGSGLTYAPNVGFTGTDTFTYTVSDGSGGFDTETVTVRVNTPPTAAADTASVQQGADATAISVLTNDSIFPDTGETLTITGVTQGDAGGTIAITGGGTGLTYRPATGFSGSEKFTYTVSDGAGGTATATVTVRVNAPPTANDDTAVVQRNGAAVPVAVLGNDTFAPDTGETLAIASVTQGAHGTVVITGGGSGVTYQPAAGYTGADTFTYTVSDGNGGTDTATVTVRVNAPPTAVDDAVTAPKNSAARTINVLANDTLAPDSIPGETLTVTSATAGSKGGTVTLGSGGTTVLYTPAAGFQGVETFAYTVADGAGGTATATVTVTVVNNNPVAAPDAFQVQVNATATALNVLSNDTTGPDTGETLTITGVTPGLKGGTVVVTGGGTGLTYQPAPGFAGIDTFTYTITDGNGGTATGTVAVTVNRPPVALDDTVSATFNGTAVTVPVLANDSDPDSGQTLTVVTVTQGTSGGKVAISGGAVTYTPATGFSGTETFTYTVSDGTGGTATASVTATVPVPPPPPTRLTAYGAAVGGPPTVTVRNADGTVRFTLTAFEDSFTGGVSAATADFTGDGIDDIVVGPGVGGGPVVKVFDGATGTELRSFFAYEEAFRGGVSLAVGDTDRDGTPDLAIAPGPGGGPRIRVLSGVDFSERLSFYAFDASFTGGVNLAVGDTNRDGIPDVIAGAGAGGGPNVRVFSGADASVITSFWAFEQRFTGGVRVAIGDVTADGRPDIIVASGAGGNRVRVFGGAAGAVSGDYLAYQPAENTAGLRVGVRDVNVDGRPDVLVAGGSGTKAKAFDGLTNLEITVPETISLDFLGGVPLA